jgi:hypothetical protein
MAENDVLIDVETLVGMLTGEDPLDAAGIRFMLDALTLATDSALGFLSAQIECHTAQKDASRSSPLALPKVPGTPRLPATCSPRR